MGRKKKKENAYQWNILPNRSARSCHMCVQLFGFKANGALSLEKQLQYKQNEGLRLNFLTPLISSYTGYRLQDDSILLCYFDHWCFAAKIETLVSLEDIPFLLADLCKRHFHVTKV